MTKEESTFYEIGSKLEGTDKSQMFGKPFFKINQYNLSIDLDFR